MNLGGTTNETSRSIPNPTRVSAVLSGFLLVVVAACFYM